MAGKLEGKVAIVTGAASGFGRGISNAFAREGAKVVVSDLREAPLAGGFENRADLTTVKEIEANGGTAVFVKCDVTSQAEVQNLVSQTVEHFGRLDIMMNNAGIYRGGKLAHEFTEDDLEACWRVNVKGTWFGCQEAVKAFLRQGDGGNIINLVSTAGLQGHPKQSVYNISKGAQANLTRCFAIEYGHEKIRVNGICPTYAKTALTRELFDDKNFDEFFVESIPLHRWGEIKDIENLAVFLASEESSYMHGVLVPLDGGETLCRYSV
jgi:NAD(P)-dependent dehydrogenase (short-subunit alcohol dehydrogenase family)